MLDEADLELTKTAFGKDEGKLVIRFFRHPVQNDAKTESEGRPIFEDVDFISIRVPGDKLSEIERPVRETDKSRFPAHWLRYKAGLEGSPITGTPLEAWPSVTRAQVEELKFFNVRTVEQLADLSDGNAQKFAGIQSLKTKAKAFLELAREGNAPIERLTAQIEERDNLIQTQGRQLAELQAKVDELMSARKK